MLQAAVSAALRKDEAAARARLKEPVAEAKRMLGNADNFMPCYHAQVLHVASGLEMAANKCAEGDALRAAADRMRAACTNKQCEQSATMFCDQPRELRFRSTKACKKPLAIEAK
jgi:hypothetical protein